MERFEKSFLLVTIAFSLLAVIQLFVSLKNADLLQAFGWSFILLLWWGGRFYLRTKHRFSFWFAFFLINLFWWPLLDQSVLRILFVIENGGIERIDGYGSPLAFLITLFFEQLLFFPLSISIVLGTIAIWRFKGVPKRAND